MTALGKGHQRQLLFGAATAIVPLFLAIVPALLFGQFSSETDGWKAFEYSVSAEADNPTVLSAMFLLQSLTEEALFRGVALAGLGMILLWAAALVFPVDRFHSANAQLLSRYRPFSVSQWFWCGIAACLLTSAAFGIVHAGNAEAGPLPVVNVMLAGIWLGWLYWGQGNLLGALAGHVVWNLLTALLGLPVSGWALADDALGFGLGGAVPGIFSGGAFGPEGSVGCTIGLLIVNAYIVLRTVLEIRRLRETESENWWKDLKPVNADGGMD